MEKSKRQRLLQINYNFVCNCIACKHSYPMTKRDDEHDVEHDEIGCFVSNLVKELTELFNSTNIKTEMLKPLIRYCIDTLMSINNEDRIAYDNRRDVKVLRVMFRKLMILCDDTQFTIRK